MLFFGIMWFDLTRALICSYQLFIVATPPRGQSFYFVPLVTLVITLLIVVTYCKRSISLCQHTGS